MKLNIFLFPFSDDDIITATFWHEFFAYIIYLQFYK